MRPTDFFHKARDPKWESELAEWLRERHEEDRLSFLRELIPHQLIVGLKLAQNTLTERSSFEKLLEEALLLSESGDSRLADATSIRYWLECVVPHLGLRRTIRVLESHLDKYPVGVEKAAYWLPSLMEGVTPPPRGWLELLHKLRQHGTSKGVTHDKQ